MLFPDIDLSETEINLIVAELQAPWPLEIFVISAPQR